MKYAYTESRFPITRGVYVVQQVDGSELIKIGRSKNIAERLNSLQTSSPCPLRLIGLEITMYEVERELFWHERLKSYRRHGEWFKVPNKILTELSVLDEDALKFVRMTEDVLATIADEYFRD